MSKIIITFLIFITATTAAGYSAQTTSTKDLAKLKILAKRLSKVNLGIEKGSEREILYEMTLLGAVNFKTESFDHCSKTDFIKPVVINGKTYTNKDKCVIIRFNYNSKQYEEGSCI